MTFVKKRRVFKIIELIQQIFYNTITRPQNLFSFLFYGRKYCEGISYYPSLRRKSRIKIWIEQLCTTLRYGAPNEYYYSYGFDVKDAKEMASYLHFRTFSKIRDSINFNYPSEVIVLKDKFLFGMFAQYLGVLTPENIGISEMGGVYDTKTKELVPVKSFFSEKKDNDLFLKPFDGQCGGGIMHLIIKDDEYILNNEKTTIDRLVNVLQNERYIIQRTVAQHATIASLHPQSLNTLRLVTIRNMKTGIIDVFPSIIRIGTGSSFVDNTSKGGIAVGIDLENGSLKSHGFYKPEFGTRTEYHPDSGIYFKNVTIPYFNECKEQAIRLHRMLPQMHSIGWDVAIGPDGPVFIEGNDRWEISGPQNCNGGLKELYFSYL